MTLMWANDRLCKCHVSLSGPKQLRNKGRLKFRWGVVKFKGLKLHGLSNKVKLTSLID